MSTGTSMDFIINLMDGEIKKVMNLVMVMKMIEFMMLWLFAMDIIRSFGLLKHQIVVLIGSAASANDISRDIAKVAKEVHIASRSVQIEELGKLSGRENVWLHAMISYICKDGIVAFEDGKEVCTDVILHRTGWKHLALLRGSLVRWPEGFSSNRRMERANVFGG